MPLTKNRGEHVKVYRPRGTKYGEGRHAVSSEAILLAEIAFEAEFGYLPRQEHTSIEMIGVTGEWVAQVFEVKD